jgi:hypothetical protein
MQNISIRLKHSFSILGTLFVICFTIRKHVCFGAFWFWCLLCFGAFWMQQQLRKWIRKLEENFVKRGESKNRIPIPSGHLMEMYKQHTGSSLYPNLQ